MSTDYPHAFNSLEAEQFHLLDVQHDQENALMASGIAQKAAAMVLEQRLQLAEAWGVSLVRDGYDELIPAGNVGRLVIGVQQEQRDDDIVVERPSVVLITTEPASEGVYQDREFVAVAERGLPDDPEVLVPAEGFTQIEAMMVAGMVDILRDEREKGFLPRLKPDLTGLRGGWATATPSWLRESF
ncbi:MAG TPA: hypothetical protein VHB72_03125 [Candidatus Saccharimonadales bacterium]|nr:hypothetical protein [Candidatus Saccharimonadales bacterium]